MRNEVVGVVTGSSIVAMAAAITALATSPVLQQTVVSRGSGWKRERSMLASLGSRASYAGTGFLAAAEQPWTEGGSVGQ